jgi:hypothetical protein
MSNQQYSEDNIVSVIVAETKIENDKETIRENDKETIRENNKETSEPEESNERRVHKGTLVPLIECPICMDDIDMKNNCIVTECGHIFHCSCLMKNAATNGFGCPMCRTVMAEQLNDDDSDEYTSEYDEEEEEMFDDNALTSFRMFQQQIEGEDVEEEPEPEDDDDFEDEDEDANALVPVLATPETIATRLAARGITLEDAVKVLLLEHEEYNEFAEVHDRRAQEIYGEIRRIIHQRTFQVI